MLDQEMPLIQLVSIRDRHIFSSADGYKAKPAAKRAALLP